MASHLVPAQSPDTNHFKWERYSASKMLGVRDAGRVFPYDELASDKSLGVSLGE
jgi:hypothetical protein